LGRGKGKGGEGGRRGQLKGKRGGEGVESWNHMRRKGKGLRSRMKTKLNSSLRGRKVWKTRENVAYRSRKKNKKE